MIYKPLFWAFMVVFWFFFQVTSNWSNDLAMRSHYENLLWFSLAVCGILMKLNQIAQRFENAQRLQNIAAKILRPKKEI